MNQEEIPILKQPATNNPYMKAASLIKNRILWDFNPESWRSRARLKSMINQYKGKKAVILCNGPSLLKVDFDLLMKSGVYTFGLNKINLLFEKTEFRPSFIAAVNHLVLEQNQDFYNQTDIPLFLESYGQKFVKSRPNVTFIKETYQQSFARDCSISVYSGYTVTFVAMQLAYHIGFDQIALVGCDHNFVTKGHANQAVVSEATDPNHFDPRYFSGGVKWHLPDLFQSEVSYQMAKEVYEASQRKIYNCTEGGKLEIYERLPLQDFLSN
ncbi:MAG: DUF115 domain-containing protein [Thermoflexibacter sp.]|jgi:hypothetical protein|nr:DUF115 domain-containing protein [Thermoflexibacter sp.]